MGFSWSSLCRQWHCPAGTGLGLLVQVKRYYNATAYKDICVHKPLAIWCLSHLSLWTHCSSSYKEDRHQDSSLSWYSGVGMNSSWSLVGLKWNTDVVECDWLSDSVCLVLFCGWRKRESILYSHTTRHSSPLYLVCFLSCCFKLQQWGFNLMVFLVPDLFN